MWDYFLSLLNPGPLRPGVVVLVSSKLIFKYTRLKKLLIFVRNTWTNTTAKKIICFGLFVLYGISTIVGYLIPNPFHTNKQFYFKQFSLTKVYRLIFKYISISKQTFLIETIQFSISTLSMSKTVPFQVIQFSIST